MTSAVTVPTPMARSTAAQGAADTLPSAGLARSAAAPRRGARAGEAAAEPVQGAQSLRRALGLLRSVAQTGEQGARLADLVRRTGLDRATAYRMLSCLVEEQFIDRDGDGQYRLGPETVLLGSRLPQPTPVLARFVPLMKRLARLSGESVYLVLRQGDHARCTHREEGDTTRRLILARDGQERLLGTSTGGMAMLGALEPPERRALHARHAEAYAALGLAPERLVALGDDVRRRGHAVGVDLPEPGVSGISVAFGLGTNGMAALSLCTHTARFRAGRGAELARLLRDELATTGFV